MSEDHRSCSRREFVRVGAGACLGAGALVSGCATVGIYQGELSREGDKIPLSRQKFEELAGKRNAVLVDVLALNAPIVLMRNSDGSFRAVSARCTHKACIVQPDEDLIYCTCHGSRFDRTGSVLQGPAQSPLPAYAVRVDGDNIEILLEPAG